MHGMCPVALELRLGNDSLGDGCETIECKATQLLADQMPRRYETRRHDDPNNPTPPPTTRQTQWKIDMNRWSFCRCATISC